MRSIGGGRVRYVSIELLECPERSDLLGECTRPGRIEMLWGDTVVEEIDVRRGDALRVVEGAVVEPGAVVLERSDWEWRVRANIPAGIAATVHWSEEPDDVRVDEVTGMSRSGFSPNGEDLLVELRDASGAVLSIVPLSRTARPRAPSGAVVRRGDILASVPLARRPETLFSSAADLRRFLDARPPPARDRAVLAPADGRVQSVEPDQIRIVAEGRELRVRRKRRQYSRVRPGDWVRAGDVLAGVERSHHDLLRIWGEQRLADHLLEELEAETSVRNLGVPKVYWELLVRAMLGWRRVLAPGDTGFRRHQIVAREAFERVQNEIRARGGVPATFASILRGLSAMARETRVRDAGHRQSMRSP